MDLATQNAIIAKIAERAGGRVGPCSVCRTEKFTLTDGFALISISDQPNLVQLGGQTLPSVALVCTNCGNTLLINLLLLGMHDLVTPKAEDESVSHESAVTTAGGDAPAVPGP